MELEAMKNSNFEVNTETMEDCFDMIEQYEKNTKWIVEEIPGTHIGINFQGDNNDIIIQGSAKNLLTKKSNTYVLDEKGKITFQQRAGLAGSTLNDLCELDWASVVNTCLPYKKGIMMMDEVCGRIYAAHSSNYVVLPLFDIFKRSIEELKKIFPKIHFVQGFLTHDFMFLDFSLIEHKEIVEAYETAFGFKLKNAVPSIRIVSSNTGKSGANIYPTITYVNDSNIYQYSKVFGNAIMLEHKGKATIEKFAENLKMSHSIIQETLDNIAKLAFVSINHPINCFLNIAQRLQLPKLSALEIAEDLKTVMGASNGNGRIVYLALTKIVDKCNGNAVTKFALSNTISRALTMNMHFYDSSKSEWLKDAVTTTGQQFFSVA